MPTLLCSELQLSPSAPWWLKYNNILSVEITFYRALYERNGTSYYLEFARFGHETRYNHMRDGSLPQGIEKKIRVSQLQRHAETKSSDVIM